MIEENQVIIRRAQTSDLEKLKEFFIKAYGESTVFQNEEFLLYYYKTLYSEPLYYSLVAVTLNGEIVSHYGGLDYKLILNDKIIPVIWGVNAFTLPEWRGKGINSKIVKYIHDDNEVNAVIGMPLNAPIFYQKFGYNIFNKETFNRFIYALNSKTFDIASHLGYPHEKVNQVLRVKNPDNVQIDSEKIVELSVDNCDSYIFDLEVDANLIATTYREINFLKWRVFENPYIKYKVFGHLNGNRIVSYIVIREEVLLPMNYRVSRIVDLFGNKEGVVDLLNHAIDYSIRNNSIYIDFSKYGLLYEEELIKVGFDKLENDEVSILPLVTAPIENRPNHEFIVIQSKLFNDEIHKLSIENVFFTRIDADRDRIARITQITRQ